jgi:hypothetical protein
MRRVDAESLVEVLHPDWKEFRTLRRTSSNLLKVNPALKPIILWV